MEWHKEYPSTVLRQKLTGDEAACKELIGFAHDLLFRVKSMMSTLKQLHGSLHFSDGSIIRASSIFGQDTISIYRPPGIRPGKRPHCMVSVINVPEAVPPSRWYIDGIQEEEQEGYHYFKTYYGMAIVDCPECWGTKDWSICKTDTLMADIGIGVGCQKCKPFIYDEKYGDIPHREDYLDTCKEPPEMVEVGDPENHCLIGGCNAEIIEFDSDGHGSFFRWKAYTEWSCADPYGVDYWSRTGLGYLLMEIKVNYQGRNLCQAHEIIRVDCCEKLAEDRDLEIWWESLGEDAYDCITCCNQPWMQIGSMKLCETPHLMGFWYLVQVAVYAYVGFNTLYFVNGACPPFEWEKEGPGTLKTCPPLYDSAEWELPEDYMGCDDLVIRTRDRCGSVHTIRASCCHGGENGGAEGGPLSIGYESLVMGFEQCQNLQALGGCPPYIWTSSGGGSLVVDPSRRERNLAEYCAPEANPNCDNNALITVIDCCGEQANLEIAISNNNHYIALRYCEFVLCGYYGEPPYEVGQIQCEWWWCDGESTGPSCYTAAGESGPCPWCYDGPCDCILQKGPPLGDNYVCTWGSRTFQEGMCCGAPNCECEVLCDMRTQEMIEAGCCPPNPFS